MATLELDRIAQAIENLEDNGYVKQFELGVESYNLISWGITEISERLERIAEALEKEEG